MQPEPTPQRDVVQESLDHRAEQQRERDDAERRKVIDRAAATTLPPGTKDIAEAEAAGYAGQFGGIFTTLLGEAEGGGFLVGIDSVAAPLQRKGRVVLLPERLYQRLESDGTMGAMLRDKAAVLVRLMAPAAPGRQPALVELEVMR